MFSHALSLIASLLMAPQAPIENAAQTIPFKLELPANYQAFELARSAGEEWHAMRKDMDGRFTVAHFYLNDPGAKSQLIAEDLRRRKWQPLLQNLEHEINAWSGNWAGGAAFGNDIAFLRQKEKRAALEYVLVELDSLLIASWEGPDSEKEMAKAALHSFSPPLSWRPKPPIDFDSGKGLGPLAKVQQSIGFFEISVDLSQGPQQEINIQINFKGSEETCSKLIGKDHIEWRLPTGITTSADWDGSQCSLSYQLPALKISEDFSISDGPVFGVWHSPLSAAFLDPIWLATPVLKHLESFPIPPMEAPSWSLNLITRGADIAISAKEFTKLKLDSTSGTRNFQFPKIASGNCWPFFLVGSFQEKNSFHYPLWLRAGAKAHKAKEFFELLTELEHSVQDWLPAFSSDWSFATFPGCGNRMLPGLWVLDEQEQWLQTSIDASYGDLEYCIAAAELLASRIFALKVHGAGSGSAFLENSLTEYAAYRILENSKLKSKSKLLLANWRQKELTAGPLLSPISLTSVSDLQGPRRLLSRGPLLWLAIEEKAGRQKLDAVLNQQLRDNSWWTTETLRLSLEERTGTSWSEFFRLYVYGRSTPNTISK